MKILAIVSGGMDSVTLAHYYRAQGHLVDALSFDYGQRHKKELRFAEKCAGDVGGKWILIDLSGVGLLLGDNSLTGGSNVPEGHYAAASMKQTVVPNRNMMMLSVAAGIAAGRGYDAIATAVHSGDHYIYPDCRGEFIEAVRRTISLGMDGLWEVETLAPFVNKTKADVAGIGEQVGVVFANTWSCYKGGEYHCGVCGTCVERREAFEIAGIDDFTVYGG